MASRTNREGMQQADGSRAVRTGEHARVPHLGRRACLVLVSGLVAWASLVGRVGAGVPPDVAARKGQAILGRMQVRFHGLEDFTANVQARVKLSLLPGMGLSGKVYYKRPDKVMVELERLPRWVEHLRQAFSGLAPTQREKSEYQATYDGDETVQGSPCYRLVVQPKEPRKSNVREIRMWIDQKDCTVPRASVNYTDGSSVTSDMTYAAVQGFMLPASQEAHIVTNHAAADVSTTFSDYCINQKLPDTVFQKKKKT